MDVSTGHDSGGNLRAITHENLRRGVLRCPVCDSRLSRAVVGPAIDATTSLAELQSVLTYLSSFCSAAHPKV